jgi:hypothetical protein
MKSLSVSLYHTCTGVRVNMFIDVKFEVLTKVCERITIFYGINRMVR